MVETVLLYLQFVLQLEVLVDNPDQLDLFVVDKYLILVVLLNLQFLLLVLVRILSLIHISEPTRPY